MGRGQGVASSVTDSLPSKCKVTNPILIQSKQTKPPQYFNNGNNSSKWHNKRTSYALYCLGFIFSLTQPRATWKKEFHTEGLSCGYVYERMQLKSLRDSIFIKSECYHLHRQIGEMA